MGNARLDEAQAGIKIAGRNINNLRYAVDITLMAKNEQELKSLLMKVKEEIEKAGLKLQPQSLKLNIQLLRVMEIKTKINKGDPINLKLESRLPEEISITLDMQKTLPLWQKAKN